MTSGSSICPIEGAGDWGMDASCVYLGSPCSTACVLSTMHAERERQDQRVSPLSSAYKEVNYIAN
jgi:hypothetical protein